MTFILAYSYSTFIHLEQNGKKSGFVNSGFVKTCDELVIGSMEERFSFVEETTSSYTSTTMKLELK